MHNNTCFSNLSTFCWLSTLELASVACDNKQGYPLYSAGPHRNLATQAVPNTGKKMESGFETNEAEWTRLVDVRTSKKFPAVDKACMATL